MRELTAEKIRDLTEAEIEQKIRDLHEEIFNLRFRNSMRQLQNPLLIRERRREIARLHTILTEHRTGVRKLAGHAETQS
jgi:large subunit ribosomal protein L29